MYSIHGTDWHEHVKAGFMLQLKTPHIQNPLRNCRIRIKPSPFSLQNRIRQDVEVGSKTLSKTVGVAAWHNWHVL